MSFADISMRFPVISPNMERPLDSAGIPVRIVRGPHVG